MGGLEPALLAQSSGMYGLATVEGAVDAVDADGVVAVHDGALR
jgi:hypothetical protein